MTAKRRKLQRLPHVQIAAEVAFAFEQIKKIERQCSRPGRWLLFRRRDTCLLLPEHFDYGLFIMIGEFRGIEVAFLRLQDVLGELEHVWGNFDVRNLIEVILRIADFVGMRSVVPTNPCTR
jgi:hypothetical protein